MARVVAASRPLPAGAADGSIARAVAAAGRRVGLRRPVPVLLSSELGSPGVWGALRPRLVLPARIAGVLSPAELDAVLLHELEHVRRRDNLTAVLLRSLCLAVWFHPLVWWLEARLLAERERACDDRVLALCAEPRVYAASLVKVLRFGLDRPVVGVSAATASDLRRRIDQIVGRRPPARCGLVARGALLAAVTLLVAASVAVSGQAGCGGRGGGRTLRATLHPRFVPPPAVAEGHGPVPPADCPRARARAG
jgi:beta-lactamase regulating signal transducer with metallopeptidase domain